MAGDSLAESLNSALNSATQPPAEPANPYAQQPGWAGRFVNYLKNTDWGAVDEALKRANPLTSWVYTLKDAQEGTLLENQKLMYGQGSRVFTDIPSGLVGMYPAIASVNAGIEANKTGQPVQPISGFAQTLDEWSRGIDRWGRENIAEPIAGRSLNAEDAGTLTRGTRPEMGAQWARMMSQALIPTPKKITAPIIAAGNIAREALGVLGPAAELTAKTIEALTPLAVSSSPSAKTMAANLVAQGALGPTAEAAVNALFPAKEAHAQIDKADQIANQGGAQATAAQDSVIGQPIVPTPTQANMLPSTGNTTADTVLGIGTGAALLWAWKNRDTARRVVDGAQRATLGYSYTKPEDASIMGLATKLKQQYGSGSAALGDSLAQVMRKGGVAESAVQDTVMRAEEAAASRRGAAASTRERAYYVDGEFMDTPVKSMPPNDLFELNGALSKDQQKLVREALWSEQELTTRERIVQKHMGAGAPAVGTPAARATLLGMEAAAARTPTGAGIFQNKYAHNLYDQPTRDLEAIRNAAYSDPKVAEVMRGYRDIVSKSIDYMQSEKRMTAPELAKFRNDNPHYVPPKLEGEDARFLDPRDPVGTFNPRTGVDVPRGARTFEELGNPMENLPRYLDEVFRSTEGKKTQRDYIQAIKHYKAAGNPVADEILGRELHGKPGSDAASRFVSWRDHNGNKSYIEIKDPVIRDALSGVTNPATLQLHHGVMSGITRAYEGAAVGASAIAGGTIFAPLSALYNTTLGTVTKSPPGIRKGWIDALSGKMGGPHIPGDWATFTADAFGIRAPTNMFQLMVDRVGQHLHNQVLTDGYLTKAIDPATLKSTADAMRAWYQKTAMYEHQKQGIMAPGSMMSIDPAKMYTDPAGALMQARGFFGSTGHFVSDMLHAISAAPNMSLRAMNKGADPTALASAMRNLSGDPGRSGAYKHAGPLAGFVNASPWFNIAIQGTGKMLGQLHSTQGFTAGGLKEVAGKSGYTAMGLVNGVMLPAIGLTLWNSMLGPEYSKYQFINQPADKGTEFYIGWPGKPPEAGWHIPMDALVRPFKVAADAMAGLYFGAFSGEMFKPENEDLKAAYAEMMHNKYLSTGKGSMANSLLHQVLMPPVHPLLQGVAAASGVQLRNYGDVRVTPQRSEQGFAPGLRPGNDNFLDRWMPTTAEDTLRGLGAGVGTFLYSVIHGMGRDLDPNAQRFGNTTKTFGQAVGTQFDEWKQRVADSTRELGSGPLFDTYRARIPSQEAAAILVNEKMKAINAIAEQFKDTTFRGAPRMMLGNRKIGLEERLGAHPAQPDQTSGAIASDIVRLRQNLEPTMQMINKKFQDHQSIQDSNKYAPSLRRALRSMDAIEINDLYTRMLQDIQRAERVMSRDYGVKIDLSKLKLEGGQLSKGE